MNYILKIVLLYTRTDITIYNKNNSLKKHHLNISRLNNICSLKYSKKYLRLNIYMCEYMLYLKSIKLEYILGKNGYFFDDPLNISRIGGLQGSKIK